MCSGSVDGVERARIARERREAEQRRRLEELRAHAAAAQAQREKRDEERRRRQDELKAKDVDRRQQVSLYFADICINCKKNAVI